MKKTYTILLVIIMFLAFSELSNSEGRTVARAPVNASPNFSLSGASEGHFCSVGSVNVCVLTQSHEDCLKLGGQKVKNCKQMIEPSTTAEHSDHNHSCMAKEDSQEPASCYGF